MTRKNHNNSAKQSAASVFKCTVSRVSKFSKEDPFNPGVTVDGFVCRRDGIFGGSLFVTHVNDKAFKPGQFIQATPKLQYPYNKDQIRIDKQKKKEMEGKGVVLRGNDDVMINLKENDSNFLKNFHQDTSHYYFGNKWNGTNILFYKYLDDTDTVRVSAKTKGTAFVGNTDHGPFFSLVLKALGGFTPSKKNNIMDNPPPLLKSFVEDEDLSGIAFELCGKEEPHLVKYDFDIALVPLYVLTKEGHMKPFLEKVDPKLVFIGGKADKSEQLESEAKERVYGEHAKEYFNIGPFEFKGGVSTNIIG